MTAKRLKVIFTVSLFSYLLFMFLVYAGFFRDYSNPVAVTRYYWDCIKNREGFLTYQIYSGDFFDEDHNGVLYIKYNMSALKGINFDIIENKGGKLKVRTEFTYQDHPAQYCVVELEKTGKIWKITGLNHV